MGLFTHASTGLVPEHARPGRRVRSEDAWDRARDDYATGASAPDVCDRHDLGLSAFRKRAREEGWRRRD